MIETKNHLITDFSYWFLKQKEGGEIRYNYLNDTINMYIKEKCKKWDLKFFMKLFQDYTINNSCIYEIDDESDILFLMKEFSSTRNSLEYVFSSTLYKHKICIQPLFLEFVYFLKDTGYLENINMIIYDYNYKFFQGEFSLGDWYEKIIRETRIVYLFQTFISNTINAYEISSFISWINSKKRRSGAYRPDLSMPWIKFQFDETELMNSIEDRRNEYKRPKVEKMYDMVRTDFDKFGFLIKHEDYLEDFIYYLMKQGINYKDTIPYLFLEQLVDEYCENARGKVNKKMLIKSIRSDKGNILDDIKNVFFKENNTKFSVNRVSNVKLHGFFMFPDTHNLSSFLKTHMRHLHNLTADILDIYYTRNDLKKNSDCYEKINKFSYLQVKEKCTPAFIVWSKDVLDVKMINLQTLTHEEIRMAIEHLVSKAEENDFDNCIKSVTSYVEELKEKKQPCIINNAPIIQQNIGTDNVIMYNEKL